RTPSMAARPPKDEPVSSVPAGSAHTLKLLRAQGRNCLASERVVPEACGNSAERRGIEAESTNITCTGASTLALTALSRLSAKDRCFTQVAPSCTTTSGVGSCWAPDSLPGGWYIHTLRSRAQFSSCTRWWLSRGCNPCVPASAAPQPPSDGPLRPAAGTAGARCGLAVALGPRNTDTAAPFMVAETCGFSGSGPPPLAATRIARRSAA